MTELDDEQKNLAESLERHRRTVERVDERAGKILVLHVAIEAEMQHLIETLLPRGELLRNIGFGNKIRILRASWLWQLSLLDKLCDAIFRFNELRNSVAHGDTTAQVDASIERLISSAKTIDDEACTTFVQAGSLICGTLAGLTFEVLKRRNPASLKPIEDAKASSAQT